MVGLKPTIRPKRPPRTDSESTLSNLPFMQPRLVDAPPKGDSWLHEIKYDGYRTQLLVDAGRARAYTRNGHDWTEKYRTIVTIAGQLPCTSAIIDGEVVVQDEQGVSDFAALRSAITSAPHRLVFFAFDLLHLNGHDLRDMAIEDRRDLLADLIEGKVPIVLSQEFDGEGADFFAAADAAGLEGIVSKRKGSRYLAGETDHWLKVKCWAEGEYDVIGVKRGDDGLPYALFASDGKRVGAAIVSLKSKVRDQFWSYVDEWAADKPTVAGPREKNATWIRPGMTATVRHLKGSDKLRHASIKALMLPVRPSDP